MIPIGFGLFQDCRQVFGCIVAFVVDHLLKVHVSLVVIIQDYITGEVLFVEFLELTQLLIERICLSEAGIPFVQVLFDGVKIVVIVTSTVRIDESVFD